ncbi:MAG: glycosyltransferase family 4 protein [Steroidobacteraceae bacterium]
MHGPSLRSALLLDISRLIWRARRRGPTGIDRVELAYARHYIMEQEARPAYAVVHLLGFVFALSPRTAPRFVADLERRWSGEMTPTRWGSLKSLARIYGHLLAGHWLAGPWLRRALDASQGSPIFLVVSHHHLARGFTIRRIRRSLGARMACLIHDLLPLEYPEYFEPGWEQRYRRLSDNIARLFDGVITVSDATADSLRKHLRAEPQRALTAVTIRTAALGARAFPQIRSTPPAADPRPYFVVLGTIEPRKNHLLLLNLWARLSAVVAQAPKLLVIGSRGWENEQIVDMLERSSRLKGLVEEHPALSDAEVGAWLRGARALLLPSFAEGFGLPLAEALTSGVPVICSDIPVFRELGARVPEYLDAHDLHAWTEAVLDYSRPDSARRAAQLKRLAHWHVPSWMSHFGVVNRLLGEIGERTLPATMPVLQQPLELGRVE